MALVVDVFVIYIQRQFSCQIPEVQRSLSFASLAYSSDILSTLSSKQVIKLGYFLRVSFGFLQNVAVANFSIYIHSEPGFVFDESTTRSAFFYNRQLKNSIKVISFVH